MSKESLYINGDGNQAKRPYLFVELPRCPHCDGRRFSNDRSIAQGDDSRKQWATCETCRAKVFIIWE